MMPDDDPNWLSLGWLTAPSLAGSDAGWQRERRFTHVSRESTKTAGSIADILAMDQIPLRLSCIVYIFFVFMWVYIHDR